MKSVAGAFLFACLACSSVLAEEPVLRTVRQVQARMASRKDMPRCRFEIEGTVIRPSQTPDKPIVLADKTGCLSVYDRRPDRLRNLAPGDVLRVAGGIRLGRGPFGTTRIVDAHCHDATVIGKTKPPVPVLVSAQEVISGKCLGQFVTVRGTVRDVFRDEIDPNYQFFILDCDGDQITLCGETGADGPDFPVPSVGDMVAASGICSQNASFRHHFGYYISPFGGTFVKIEEPFSGDLFNAPRISLTEVDSPAKISALGRRKITGRVTAVWQDDTVLLQCDESYPDEFVKVEFLQPPPNYGDCIDAVGHPETDLIQINLVRAFWRPSETLPVRENTPTNVTMSTLLSSTDGRFRFNMDFHGRTVVVTGTIHDFILQNDVPRGIILDCGRSTIRIDCSACPDALTNLERGCGVSVTGTCIMDTEKWRPNSVFPQIKGLFVVVRKAADVTVVRSAPFWTLGKLFLIIAVLVVILLITLAWNTSLRILSERRSRALLRSQIDKVTTELRIEERTRLSVELHDTLSQNLSGIACQIVASKGAVSLGEAEVLKRLDTAERMLRSSRTELKRCLFDLRGRALENPNFEEALRSSLAPVIENATVTIRFPIARARLLDTTAHAVICIIRELAANAVCHGHASVLKIAGCIDRSFLTFSVEDNGSGFDPSTCNGPSTGHFGLEGIRERVKRLDGTLTIRSRANHGAYAKVSILMPQINAFSNRHEKD